MHVTLPLKTAVNLLRGYLGMEVTVTYRDHAGYTTLLEYAQGLHAKCDELGKERDTLRAGANFWYAKSKSVADERDAIKTYALELENECDELGSEKSEAIAVFKRILTEERVKWERSINEVANERDEFQLAWNATVVENDRLRGELRKMMDEARLDVDRLMAERIVMGDMIDEAREWARYLYEMSNIHIDAYYELSASIDKLMKRVED